MDGLVGKDHPKSPHAPRRAAAARRVLRQQGSRVGAKRLVQAVTSDAARIAALDDKLGRIRPGVPADLLVLQGHHYAHATPEPDP